MHNLHRLVRIGQDGWKIAVETGDNVTAFNRVMVGRVTIDLQNTARAANAHRGDFGIHPVASFVWIRQQGSEGTKRSAHQIKHRARRIAGRYRIPFNQQSGIGTK